MWFASYLSDGITCRRARRLGAELCRQLDGGSLTGAEERYSELGLRRGQSASALGHQVFAQ